MQVILFDIDGTLISTGGAGRDALNTALEVAFAVRDPHPVFLQGRTDRGICQEYFAQHGITATEANWERFQAAYLASLEQHLTSRPRTLLPGVQALLAELQALPRLAVGLLTGNVREGARRKLTHYGLHERFPFGGFGDLHPERDDVAREALAAACTHTGLDLRGDQVWVIGDTPADIRCARAIGAHVIAVATGDHQLDELAAAQPDVLVTNLTTTAEILEHLTSGL
jgi:phosphoglycolate phosphatase-like HAD superfamily hydrolase